MEKSNRYSPLQNRGHQLKCRMYRMLHSALKNQYRMLLREQSPKRSRMDCDLKIGEEIMFGKEGTSHPFR